MTLADQIIEHKPWPAAGSFSLELTGADVNALRDELIEGRRLRAAAEARQELTFAAHGWNDAGTATVRIGHPRCGLNVVEICGAGPMMPLAELVRRADGHTEGCR